MTRCCSPASNSTRSPGVDVQPDAQTYRGPPLLEQPLPWLWKRHSCAHISQPRSNLSQHMQQENRGLLYQVQILSRAGWATGSPVRCWGGVLSKGILGQFQYFIRLRLAETVLKSLNFRFYQVEWVPWRYPRGRYIDCYLWVPGLQI